MLGIEIQNRWKETVKKFANSPKGRMLEAFLRQESERGAEVYPPNPFRALQLVSPESVRVVILGQDPYHTPGVADGLAFSVGPENRPAPSLRNIFKEIQREYGPHDFVSGDLTGWAKQGVLLLNSVFTVRMKEPGSHAKKGWELLSDEIIRETSRQGRPIVYMLWGNHAKKKRALIESCGGSALILESNHPSPLSATKAPEPFIGNGHFQQANEWLKQHNQPTIDWLNTDA